MASGEGGKTQCAYCKEEGHWAGECPKKKKPIQTMALEDENRGETGRTGFRPLLPKPRVTLKVEGKPTSFLVDSGAQHSVLLTPEGKVSSKKYWVQGATAIIQYSSTT